MAHSGGKMELVDAILREISDDTSLKSKENMILQVCVDVLYDCDTRYSMCRFILG